MNIKKKIRNSWQTEQLSNEFDKKDYLKFKPKSSFRISLSFYILSMSCVILIFTSILLVDKIGINKKQLSDEPLIENPVEKIDFGILDPYNLSIYSSQVNKININNMSYYNVRTDFSTWFNGLDIKKADVKYNTINLNDYIDNVNPVKIGIANSEYHMYFTKSNFLILCYEDKYIMYDLENADYLLSLFVSAY